MGQGCYWNDGNVWSKSEVVVAQHGECAKCHEIVHFKVITFMPCEFHLIKCLLSQPQEGQAHGRSSGMARSRGSKASGRLPSGFRCVLCHAHSLWRERGSG